MSITRVSVVAYLLHLLDDELIEPLAHGGRLELLGDLLVRQPGCRVVREPGGGMVRQPGGGMVVWWYGGMVVWWDCGIVGL